MDNFIVSARKYRPSTFASVVGQEAITRTLKNAIRSGQLAQAFLFCGPRGVGKTTCARILAKTINCTNVSEELEPCNECDSCLSFNDSASFNVHELDAASNNSVEDIRCLVDQVRIPPQAGKYKVYIIDEVHMLSSHAFNAFLKTLEEPPPYAKFILATTEKHQIIPTILSRCQIFDFRRISVEDMVSHLQWVAEKENVEVDQDGLHIIAQKADGALRDSLSIFDQLVSSTAGNLSYKSVIENLNVLDYDYYFRITTHLLKNDISNAFLLFNEVLENGFDGQHFLNGLSMHYRNLLVCQDEITLQLLETSDNLKKRYIDQASESNPRFLLTALDIANQHDLSYKASNHKRLQIELALLQMAALQQDVSPVEKTAPVPEKVKPVEKEVNETPKPRVQEPEAEPIPKPVEHKRPEKETEPVHTPGVQHNTEKKDESIPSGEQKKNEPLAKPKAANKRIPVPNTLSKNNRKDVKKESVKEALNIPLSEQKPLDQNSLNDKWKNFIESEVSKMTIKSTLLVANPTVLSEKSFRISLGNAVQQEFINECRSDLMEFLRIELKNPGLEMEIILLEDDKAPRKAYTTTEKFKEFVKRNPSVEEFRKQFDLDIDY